MAIRRLSRRNRPEWLLDYYEGPRRIRKWYKSKALAEAAEADLKTEHKHAGQSWLRLSPAERNDLMTIHAEAQGEGIALRTIWEAYKAGKLGAAPIVRRTLAQAIKETMEWRRSENLRERYLTELESYLLKFSSRSGQKVASPSAFQSVRTRWGPSPIAPVKKRVDH